MTTSVRVLAFLAALAAVFALGFGVGTAVGPIDGPVGTPDLPTTSHGGPGEGEHG